MRVRVPLEHRERLVTRDRHDNRVGDTGYLQLTDEVVSKVVSSHVLDARAPAEALPALDNMVDWLREVDGRR